jgi:hypothetical protein
MGEGSMTIGSAITRQPGFRVRIIYREPEFQRRNPHCPREFSSLFEVPDALSGVEAVRRALLEWDFCARHSGVSWERVIQSVVVEP